MSTAQTKAARRRMRLRYGPPPRNRRSVHEAIARERAKAAREEAARKKK